MVRNWAEEAYRDIFRRRAKTEGFRSRAAYKLLEADKRFRLIKKGDIVVELGAWPGGMTQAASRLVGETGLVIAVDIRKFKAFSESNIITINSDILEEEDTVQKILQVLNGKQVDVVISDASPKFTGIRDVDIARQIELTEKSYNISLKLVKKGGSIMLKALECRELELLEEQIRSSFSYVKRFIPSATRKTSSEIYLIGLKRY
ncbi:MAG: RlmE family RNA methyltransferase [Thaumarchaeota archaeon]|jgi:23S rRNA (uridine2552-2'-O)-methyltransferase|nr:RlmE family RNA methyltransferase [Candidatus Geocrenenecus arthurdayi]MCL7391106.1 RlmE family RNA methyltransferase [Candidatus Geocrenenecus arthurdayi]